MATYYSKLYPSKLYHIFTRATGSEKLFLHSENYVFFLQKFQQHISPIASVWAWCLLPNHFHFFIEIKSLETIEKHFAATKKNTPFSEEQIPDFLMERFSNLLNSYTKAFNKVYNRKGSLFIDYLRRIEIENTEQIGATIFYIHKNPVHHHYCKKIDDWQWSSYKTMLSTATTNLEREKVLAYFGNVNEYFKYHQQEIALKNAIIINED